MRDREEILTRLDPIAWPHGVQSTVGRESRNRVSFTGSQLMRGRLCNCALRIRMPDLEGPGEGPSRRTWEPGGGFFVHPLSLGSANEIDHWLNVLYNLGLD